MLASRFKVITSHHVNIFVILFIAGMLTGSVRLSDCRKMIKISYKREPITEDKR